MPEPEYFGRVVIPLASVRLESPPGREIQHRTDRSNAAVLDLVLQKVDIAALPRPRDERLDAALAPLRMKLDMLIGLVARLSYRDAPLPPSCAVELGPVRIAWDSLQHCQRGDWLRLDLYFDATVLEPVSLFAEVCSCAEERMGEARRVEAWLAEMAASTRERLARVAFLTRRRQQIECRAGDTASAA